MAKAKSFDPIRDAIRSDPRSLRELARQTGIDVSALSRFVNGERQMGEEAIGTLCRVLGIQLVVTSAPERR